jgi:hypothetical protein
VRAQSHSAAMGDRESGCREIISAMFTSSQRVIVATSYAMLLAAVLVDTEHLVIDGRQILSLFANQSPMVFHWILFLNRSTQANVSRVSSTASRDMITLGNWTSKSIGDWLAKRERICRPSIMNGLETVSSERRAHSPFSSVIGCLSMKTTCFQCVMVKLPRRRNARPNSSQMLHMNKLSKPRRTPRDRRMSALRPVQEASSHIGSATGQLDQLTTSRTRRKCRTR